MNAPQNFCYPRTTDVKIRDIVQRPDYYANIVLGMREHLAVRHSYSARFLELMRLVEG